MKEALCLVPGYAYHMTYVLKNANLQDIFSLLFVSRIYLVTVL